MKNVDKFERLEHLNLVLQAIRNINRLIIREKDCTRLLKGVCKNLIKNRSYHNAWIALFDPSGDLLMTAEAGLGDQFLPLVARLRKGELTVCARKALSQSGLVAMADPISTCPDCPLSPGYGGRGAMTIRLEHEGRVYGIASVSVPKHLATDREEKGLLKEIAGDVAFALHSRELDKKYKQVVDEFKRSADEYRTIFENTGTATIIIDEDRIISLANTEFEKLSGYAKQEVEGKKSWADFVAEKNTLEKMKAYHALRRINPNAAPRNYVYKFADKRGIVKDVFATVALIPETGKSVGSFLDITELKRTEKALLESEQRFRELVENSLTGIFIVQDGQIVYENPEQRKFSVSLPNSFKHLSLKYVHPDDVEKVKKGYEKLALGEVQTLDMDFRFYPPGKTDSKPDMKWVYWRASRIQYRGKEAALVNMMDVTKVKELENLLRIQDKMSSLGHVAAGIAHEIRNPLSGINIYLNTLEKLHDRGASSERVKEILGQAQAASRKIESIIRRVMDFSKPGAPQFAFIDINQPIEEAISLSSATLRKTGITLEKSLAEDLRRCRADSHLIEEVILNLITNATEAIKHTDKNKKIGVASSMEENHVVVSVSDSGPGVASGFKEKIFDPFYTTKSEGTGIGLALCQRIISDHGGRVNVSTSKWGGAEFTIEIPIKE
jgi:PAS domain S-box-containing protein